LEMTVRLVSCADRPVLATQRAGRARCENDILYAAVATDTSQRSGRILFVGGKSKYENKRVRRPVILLF
jgi:hypothetical protein